MGSDLPASPAESAHPALLVLEDGSAFPGVSVGATGERAFELVFNTAMTGYQEILTDPSYAGQGVVMTYPQIGNYGVCLADDESDRCWAEALIMRQLSLRSSNWRADMSLGDYLVERGVLGIEGVDTRELTLKLREHGALRAVLSTERFDVEAMAEKARAHPSLEGKDLAARVSCTEPYTWEYALPGPPEGHAPEPTPVKLADNAPHVVCYDFGVKRNILRCMISAGMRLTVVPASTNAEDVLALKPDGLFLSNGPGDPAAVDYAHREVRKIVDTGLPTFGICLGHQILAHVFGAQTFKMKFGHHGANHPVVATTGRIDISSQNHGFAVEESSLAGTGLRVTHNNGNDGTVAGMEHESLPVFSVQYHPEAAPGPHDPRHLFAQFHAWIVSGRPAAV
jgi:carbamoyl-phosphate synthase small subunit